MCGLYAWIGDGKPNFNRLYDAARNAIRRGRDAFGIAWIQDGQIVKRAAIAPFEPVLNEMIEEACEKAEGFVIGHARLTTHGTKTSIHEVHPFVRGDIAAAHNGVFYNYGHWAKEWKIRMTTGCDSEVLRRGSLSSKDRFTSELSQRLIQPVPSLVCRSPANELVGISRGNPLGVVRFDDGYYLCSNGKVDGVEVEPLRDGLIYFQKTPSGAMTEPQLMEVLSQRGMDARQRAFGSLMDRMEATGEDPDDDELTFEIASSESAEEFETWYASNMK